MDQKQEGVIVKSRFDSLAIRFSSLMVLLQSVFTIPPFIIMLTLGINHQHQCPIQPLIVTFLIVHGCSQFVNGALLLIAFLAANHIQRTSILSACARRILIVSLIGQVIVLVFSIVWTIIGQIWVFGAQINGFQSNDSTQSQTYCHAAIYWNAFATIIITYAVWFIVIIILFIKYLIRYCKKKSSSV